MRAVSSEAMHIVVLDGHTLNPGDLSWEALQSLGTCDIFDHDLPPETLKRAPRADVLLINKAVLSRDLILNLPLLKYIGVMATGYNVIDMPAARERGIIVTNVPNYGTKAVAQMTLALLLELTQHVGHHAKTVSGGRWSANPDFCYWDYPLIELDGLTMGIVGLGNIGRAVAGLSAAFGMKVLAHTRTPPRAVTAQVQLVELEPLFRQSDVVSLHCPLTPETERLVNATRLGWMKPGAFLLNTSRGPLIDQAALADALNAGRIAGAGLDVLAVEPPPEGNPLLRARNCLVTPHIAWATRAARSRLMTVLTANLKSWMDGRPQNVVS